MAQGSRSRRTPRRSGGGSGIVFGIVLLGALFAFFQIPVNPSVHGTIDTLQARSAQVEAWAKSVADGSFKFSLAPAPAPAGGGSTAPASATDTVNTLNTLTVADASGVKYDRGEWHHWSDIRPCWNTRSEVLYRDAQPGSVTLLDANKVPTTDLNKACYVSGGVWIDPYTGEQFTNPSDLDIDHMIPLNYAAQHGGQAWDTAKKESYANNLDYKDHLIAVSASANRSKSDQGPSSWKPSNEGDWCTYATDWVTISSTWGLSITQADKDAVGQMLQKCPA